MNRFGLRVRSVVLASLIGWVVAPPLWLLLAVLSGQIAAPEAGNLAAWLILPWAVVLAAVVLVRAMLGPASRTANRNRPRRSGR